MLSILSEPLCWFKKNKPDFGTEKSVLTTSVFTSIFQFGISNLHQMQIACATFTAWPYLYKRYYYCYYYYFFKQPSQPSWLEEQNQQEIGLPLTFGCSIRNSPQSIYRR